MKNVVKILIIVFTIILILGGGAFAYLYFATDVLKSDRQLFDKYISKNLEIIDIFKDESLASYYTKKLNTPYENKGKYKVTGIEEYLPENAKDMEIAFNGETDVQNNYKHEKIEVNYNKDTSMAVSLLQNGNYYGIKFEEILKKYLALENNNLKEFAKNIGIEDIEDVPNKIDLGSINKSTKFTEEELKEMKKIIQNRLKEEISDEKFTSNKQENTVYTLNVSLLDIYNVSKKIAEDFINNDLIKNRLKEIYKEQNNLNDEEAEQWLEDFKNRISENINNDIDEEELSEANITISVYVENEKMLRTEILMKDSEDGSYKININYEQNKIVFDVQNSNNENFETIGNVSIEKTKKDDEISYLCTVKADDFVALNIEAKWIGIDNLEKVTEQYGIEVQSDSNKIKYLLTNNVEFVEAIDDKVAQKELKVVNSYNEEQLQSTIEKLFSAIQQLNKNKMEQIGVEEDENPIIYYIPFISSLLLNNKNDSNDSYTLTEIEQKVMEAKEQAQLECVEYKVDAQVNVSVNNQQISIKDYIISNWKESKNPSLYTVNDGVVTLEVPNSTGQYITGSINEEGRINWND